MASYRELGCLLTDCVIVPNQHFNWFSPFYLYMGNCFIASQCCDFRFTTKKIQLSVIVSKFDIISIYIDVKWKPIPFLDSIVDTTNKQLLYSWVYWTYDGVRLLSYTVTRLFAFCSGVDRCQQTFQCILHFVFEEIENNQSTCQIYTKYSHFTWRIVANFWHSYILYVYIYNNISTLYTILFYALEYNTVKLVFSASVIVVC